MTNDRTLEGLQAGAQHARDESCECQRRCRAGFIDDSQHVHRFEPLSRTQINSPAREISFDQKPFPALLDAPVVDDALVAKLYMPKL